MASEKPDAGGFLAVIDAKIAALQQLRESLIAAISLGALGAGDIDPSTLPSMPAGAGSTSVGQSPASGPIELPTGVFRNQGLADAIRLYLSIAKRKQTIKEIATALQDGGLATTAGSFEQTLSATLYRLKSTGELLKFKDGWDLAESYPESFRQRLAQSSEGAAPKRKRKAKGKKKAEAAPNKQASKGKATDKPTDKAEPILRAV